MADSGRVCKCGGHIAEGEHEVKTSKGAAEWTDALFVVLPLSIAKRRCRACGRSDFVVRDANGKILRDTRGAKFRQHNHASA